MRRYRYRTPVVLGRWHETYEAARNDAIRTGLAVLARREPGGLRWCLPGEIEEEPSAPEADPLRAKH